MSWLKRAVLSTPMLRGTLMGHWEPSSELLVLSLQAIHEMSDKNTVSRAFGSFQTRKPSQMASTVIVVVRQFKMH